MPPMSISDSALDEEKVSASAAMRGLTASQSMGGEHVRRPAWFMLSEADRKRQGHTPVLLWCGMGFLAALGSLGLYPVLLELWRLWTTDPLRSSGCSLPPSPLCWCCASETNCWQLRGTWWGLLPLGLSLVLIDLCTRYGACLDIGIGNSHFGFLPAALPIYLYGSGVILLFAGPRVWRRPFSPWRCSYWYSRCPPRSVLGYLASGLIGAYRSLLRYPYWLCPYYPQLRLMFSPDFGMFIAPGCDGMRGAVTMGYMALIFG